MRGPDEGEAGFLLKEARFQLAVTRAMLGTLDLDQILYIIGVACMLHDHLEGDELFRRADAALYRAKESGRNQTYLAEQSAATR